MNKMEYEKLAHSLRTCEGACSSECELYNTVQIDGDTCQKRLCGMAAEAKEEFVKWLCRLAKRVSVTSVMVSVSSWEGQMLIHDEMDKFWKMFESPSWANDDFEPTWCEYLMWDKAKNSDMPMALCYKYYEDPENDAEFKCRYEYRKGAKRG